MRRTRDFFSGCRILRLCKPNTTLIATAPRLFCRLVYFDGVVAQIMQHLRTLDDPHLRQQWLRAKEELTQEFSVVKDIVNELKRFKDPPGGM